MTGRPLTMLRRGTAIIAASMTITVGVATQADAKPTRQDAAWTVTKSTGSTPTPTDAPPQTNSSAPNSYSNTLAGTPEDDLKQVCRSQYAATASTQQGWMTDRFNRCYIGHRKVELKCPGCTTTIASVEFDYTLVGIAQNGTRLIDWYLTFDDWKPLGGPERETTPMRVSLTGCGGLVSCGPANAELTQPLGTWHSDPAAQFKMTSADQTGIGDSYIATAQVRLNMAILPTRPDIVPWIESDMTTADIRFDSAGPVVGRHHGAVFADFISTFDLLVLARADNNEGQVQESIQHIDDALHRVERTWPSFGGKSIPGEYKASLGPNQRPLHRLVNETLKDRNRDYAGKVCKDVWGDGSATPNLNCDEYPFASTYEGAYVGSNAANGDPDGWQTWNGSSRLIGEEDNQIAGTRYLSVRFYQANRILDNDPFFVAITR